MKKYTKQELIENLIKISEELGRAPRIRHLTYPSLEAYKRVFGSWSNALKAAGFTPLDQSKYTKERLIGILKQIYAKTGKAPTSKMLPSLNNCPGIQVFKSRFGSWSNALKQAGIPISRTRYTKEELIGFLKKRHAETKQVPSKNEINSLKGYPDSSTFRTQFGSWNNAIIAAGFEPNKPGSEKKKKSFWQKLFRE